VIPSVTILEGDALARLREMPDESVQCCVTSPPYFGLRDYGVEGQMGLEATPELYVTRMVEVFREVRRVLRKDGTLWLNVGDSYAGSGKGGNPKESPHQKQRTNAGSLIAQTARDQEVTNVTRKTFDGVKAKDLIGIPWMLAFALRADEAASPAHMRDIESMISAVTDSYETADEWPAPIRREVERLQREHIAANRGGWYLRCDIVWAKANCMPESVTDRPTRSHEFIFLLTKEPRYYYDAEAIKEPCVYDVDGPGTASRKARQHEANKLLPTDRHNGIRAGGYKNSVNFDGKNAGREKQRGHSRRHDGFNDRWDDMKREEQCTGMRNKRDVWTVAPANYAAAHFATFPPDLIKPCILAGTKPGDRVLDPFGGSGTTGMVALELGRNATLIELNPAYAVMARARCDVTPGFVFGDSAGRPFSS